MPFSGSGSAQIVSRGEPLDDDGNGAAVGAPRGARARSDARAEHRNAITSAISLGLGHAAERAAGARRPRGPPRGRCRARSAFWSARPPGVEPGRRQRRARADRVDEDAVARVRVGDAAARTTARAAFVTRVVGHAGRRALARGRGDVDDARLVGRAQVRQRRADARARSAGRSARTSASSRRPRAPVDRRLRAAPTLLTSTSRPPKRSTAAATASAAPAAAPGRPRPSTRAHPRRPAPRARAGRRARVIAPATATTRAPARASPRAVAQPDARAAAGDQAATAVESQIHGGKRYEAPCARGCRSCSSSATARPRGTGSSAGRGTTTSASTTQAARRPWRVARALARSCASRIYSSDLARARETAAALARVPASSRWSTPLARGRRRRRGSGSTARGGRSAVPRRRRAQARRRHGLARRRDVRRDGEARASRPSSDSPRATPATSSRSSVVTHGGVIRALVDVSAAALDAAHRAGPTSTITASTRAPDWRLDSATTPAACALVLLPLAETVGRPVALRRIAATDAASDVLQRHEDVPVELDVRTSSSRQYAVRTPPGTHRRTSELDVLALVLLAVVLHDAPSDSPDQHRRPCSGGRQPRSPTCCNPGGDLLSQAVAHQVPSAQRGLTTLFGMGRGVTLSPWPPEISSQRARLRRTLKTA